MSSRQNSQVSRLSSDWTVSDSKLSREVELENFAAAVSLVNQIAGIAEAAGHHPDLCLFAYNRLRIEITTHAEGKLTRKDYRLATAIGSVLSSS